MTRRAGIVRYVDAGPLTEASDDLAVEEPLEIRIAGEPVSVTMRTPGHDTELVAGLLLSERMIAAGERPIIRHVDANTVDVAASVRADTVLRSTISSSSCGLCGKTSIAALQQHFPPLDDETRVPRSAFGAMLDALTASQTTFAKTGGLHAAALFPAGESMMVAREDVGRHNAVDKVVGYAVLRGLLPLSGHTLLVSGRVSFEIVQKAIAARIPLVAAVSAPTSLAVQLADDSEQTLVGFLRDGRFNVYTHPERIDFAR